MQSQRGIVFGGLAPHPPIVIPEVGGHHLAQVKATVAALDELASRIAQVAPRTLVIISPHGPTSREAFTVLAAPVLTGDLAEFGAPSVHAQVRTDLDLLAALQSQAQLDDMPLTAIGGGREAIPSAAPGAASRRRPLTAAHELHYATLVPLLFMLKGGFDGRVLVLTTPYTDLATCYRFGQSLAAAAAVTGRPAAVLASGDLSHRLQPGAPAGYDPRGPEFDRYLVAALEAQDYRRLLEIDEDLADGAAECGLRPLVTMLGAIAHAPTLRPQVLSYEGPFGVGYAVAAFDERSTVTAQVTDAAAVAATPEPHPLVALARQAVETYVHQGKLLAAPAVRPAPDQPAATGAFVSLYRRGQLRGCIGTIAPTQATLAEEVIHNAVAASSEDPRFMPIGAAELADLVISVDVLGPAEPVDGPADLDPHRFGVIVEKGRRRGLLLPDLQGVDTVQEQISIAAHKAGLDPKDPGLKLSRFRVERLR